MLDRSHVNSFAVMIVTRDRPNALRQSLTSLAGVRRPVGVECHVIVADNSDQSKETAIRALADEASCPILYTYEPRRGYSSVRNAAITKALEIGADVMMFTDDDVAAAPDVIASYLERFATTGADIVAGVCEPGSSKFREGQRVRKASTSNVAFRRRVVASNGLGMRFDPRLNLLGYEDFTFFEIATAKGAVMVRSHKPRVACQPDHHLPAAEQKGHVAEAVSRTVFARMSGRNDIVAARIAYGWWFALYRLAMRYGPIAQRVLATHVAVAADALAGRDASANSLERLVAATKLRGAIEGLFLDGFDRPAAKRGLLLPANAIVDASRPTAHVPVRPTQPDVLAR